MAIKKLPPSDDEVEAYATYRDECIIALIAYTTMEVPVNSINKPIVLPASWAELASAVNYDEQTANEMAILNKHLDNAVKHTQSAAASMAAADADKAEASTKHPKGKHKLALNSVLDEVKHIVAIDEAQETSCAVTSSRNQKEPVIMTTAKPIEEITTVTTTTISATPATPTVHTTSPEVAELIGRMEKTVVIDPLTCEAVYGMSFVEALGTDTTLEDVNRVLGKLNNIAIAATATTGTAAIAFGKQHPELADKTITGKFQGPGRAHVAVSYKPTSTVPSGGGTKVYHGTTTTSWKNLGGPAGNDYDAIKAMLRAGAEASQAE